MAGLKRGSTALTMASTRRSVASAVIALASEASKAVAEKRSSPETLASARSARPMLMSVTVTCSRKSRRRATATRALPTPPEPTTSTLTERMLSERVTRWREVGKVTGNSPGGGESTAGLSRLRKRAFLLVGIDRGPPGTRTLPAGWPHAFERRLQPLLFVRAGVGGLAL